MCGERYASFCLLRLLSAVVYRGLGGLGGLHICVSEVATANTSGKGTFCGLLHSDDISLSLCAYRGSLYLPRTLGVDSNGCSYGFGSAWNFALACRGTASSFVFCVVVAAVLLLLPPPLLPLLLPLLPPLLPLLLPLLPPLLP
jgi:hypothetical protein